MNTTRKTIHMVLAVDIDRFTDAKIRRDFLPMLAKLGAASVIDVRRICREYRAKGYEAFPSCDHHDERGYCLGHDAADEPPCAPDDAHPHRCKTHDLSLLGINGRCGRAR